MKKERYAVGLILMAFFSGMVLTAATSGCDSPETTTAATKASAGTPGSPEANSKPQ